MPIPRDKTSIQHVGELEELLSEPTEATVRAMRDVDGDILVLGVGGKIGPTLARMARRASRRAGVDRRVIGVSRFSSSSVVRERLDAWGVETLSCDLLDPVSLQALPEAANVIYLAGMKFGSSGQESLTWAMNSFLPGLVAAKYRHSRIVALSTGNIYGLTPVSRGGSTEQDAPNPVGEYAMSCLGRERILEHFSRTQGTKMALVRLNYATELRYGVLVDIALKVRSGQPVPLGMGHLNSIWQGDASAATLQALIHVAVPPLVINLTGADTLSVRRIAETFGRHWGIPVAFEGIEADDALLANADRSQALFGAPEIPIEQLTTWIADWVGRNQETLKKPTHFEERAGRF